jgi:hypothetical protein
LETERLLRKQEKDTGRYDEALSFCCTLRAWLKGNATWLRKYVTQEQEYLLDLEKETADLWD